MHAVIRTFPGSGGGAKLIDLLEGKKDEVEGLMRPVKGFVSYSLIRTADGMVSVTVCQDKAGCDESSRLAKEWTGKNASDLGVSPPTVVEGAVVLHLK
jgi:hypothetical protein